MIKITFKEQLNKIKENWFIFLLLALFVLFALSDDVSQGIFNIGSGYSSADSVYSEKSANSYSRTSQSLFGASSNFAPDVSDRLIIKTGTISAEVSQGKFFESVAELKSIVKSSNGYILNENINKYDSSRSSYYTGYFSIKVDSSKYDATINLIKEIGEVTYFNEGSTDVTGEYKDLTIELDVEKERLLRYKLLYNETKETKDKIDLNDRIFNQERIIKYYEDELSRKDKDVKYVTIYYTITEKKSYFSNVVFIKFSELAVSFVNSINAVFDLFFSLLPWVVFFIFSRFIYLKFFKSKTESELKVRPNKK